MSLGTAKNLSKDELEQYTYCSRRGFPFEGEGDQIAEVNAARGQGRHYDEWVQKSYAALAHQFRRYGKVEIGEQLVESIR